MVSNGACKDSELSQTIRRTSTPGWLAASEGLHSVTIIGAMPFRLRFSVMNGLSE